MTKEKRGKILQLIDSRFRVMALISIIAEALFLGSLVALPSDQRLYALIACLSILVVTLIGITIIEYTEVKTKKSSIENKEILTLPEDIRSELNLSFTDKRDKLSEDQREILSYIERNTALGGAISQGGDKGAGLTIGCSQSSLFLHLPANEEFTGFVWCNS